MPSSRLRRWLMLAAGFAVIGAAALALRRLAEQRACVPDLSLGGARLTYDLDAARAADEVFARGLDLVVARLRSRGAIITRIAPKSRAATLSLASRDESAWRDAVSGTPLRIAPDPQPALPGVELALSLPEPTAQRIEEAAILEVARRLRARLAAALPCPPTVERLGARLFVGLPRATRADLEQAKQIANRDGQFDLARGDGGAPLQLGLALVDERMVAPAR